jgi:anti-sigma regulatory factor (Ser/Thr protein kinase)
MELALKVLLPASRKAPSLARNALLGLNGELDGVREPVTLLVSELVTNSVRHADLQPDDRIGLEVAADTSAVRVEVSDPGPGFTMEDVPDLPGPEGGFGLNLVRRIADRWGTAGSRVWFEIERPQRRGKLRIAAES